MLETIFNDTCLLLFVFSFFACAGLSYVGELQLGNLQTRGQWLYTNWPHAEEANAKLSDFYAMVGLATMSNMILQTCMTTSLGFSVFIVLMNIRGRDVNSTLSAVTFGIVVISACMASFILTVVRFKTTLMTLLVSRQSNSSTSSSNN